MTKDELLAGDLEKVSRVANRLGIDRNTIYRWIQAKKIPFVCINGVYRIPSRAVDEMLVNGLNAGENQAIE